MRPFKSTRCLDQGGFQRLLTSKIHSECEIRLARFGSYGLSKITTYIVQVLFTFFPMLQHQILVHLLDVYKTHERAKIQNVTYRQASRANELKKATCTTDHLTCLLTDYSDTCLFAWHSTNVDIVRLFNYHECIPLLLATLCIIIGPWYLTSVGKLQIFCKTKLCSRNI